MSRKKAKAGVDWRSRRDPMAQTQLNVRKLYRYKHIAWHRNTSRTVRHVAHTSPYITHTLYNIARTSHIHRAHIAQTLHTHCKNLRLCVADIARTLSQHCTKQSRERKPGSLYTNNPGHTVWGRYMPTTPVTLYRGHYLTTTPISF